MHPLFEKRLQIIDSSRNTSEHNAADKNNVELTGPHCSLELMKEFLLRMYGASEDIIGATAADKRHAKRLLIALDSILMANRTKTGVTEAEQVIAEALESADIYIKK